MKPALRQVTPNPGYSFTIRKDTADAMINNWHYHPEFEILYIKKSMGTWLVGDYIGAFKVGDVVLVGSNLPHCYKHDSAFLVDDKDGRGETIAVFFLENIFGKEFLNLPESDSIKKILNESYRGLKIIGKSQKKCAKLLNKMLDMSPSKRLIKLLTLLNSIAERKEYEALSSGVFSSLGNKDQNNIEIVFNYTLSHFQEKISIDYISSLIHMTPYSFCRFFKKKTKKTYLEFLTEVRIGIACKLLVEDEKNVTQVCYHCGFNNLSHFHHHFKGITGMKPLEYKKNYLSKKR